MVTLSRFSARPPRQLDVYRLFAVKLEAAVTLLPRSEDAAPTTQQAPDEDDPGAEPV